MHASASAVDCGSALSLVSVLAALFLLSISCVIAAAALCRASHARAVHAAWAVGGWSANKHVVFSNPHHHKALALLFVLYPARQTLHDDDYIWALQVQLSRSFLGAYFFLVPASGSTILRRTEHTGSTNEYSNTSTNAVDSFMENRARGGRAGMQINSFPRILGARRGIFFHIFLKSRNKSDKNLFSRSNPLKSVHNVTVAP
jgi:hypothetical protein